MNQEFNDAERESKLRMQVIYEGSKKPKREWVGLTYEDMVDLQKELFDKKGEMVLPTTFARAIEAKLKERNT